MFHTNPSYDPDTDGVSLGERPPSRAYSVSPGRSRGVSDQSSVRRFTTSSDPPSSTNHRKQSDEICFEQHVPDVEIKEKHSSSDDDSYYSWKRIREQRRGERDEDSGLSRRVRRFYKTQDELIDVYERVHNQGNTEAETKFEDQQAHIKKMANILTKVSLAANIVCIYRSRDE